MDVFVLNIYFSTYINYLFLAIYREAMTVVSLEIIIVSYISVIKTIEFIYCSNLDQFCALTNLLLNRTLIIYIGSIKAVSSHSYKSLHANDIFIRVIFVKQDDNM